MEEGEEFQLEQEYRPLSMRRPGMRMKSGGGRGVPDRKGVHRPFSVRRPGMRMKSEGGRGIPARQRVQTIKYAATGNEDEKRRWERSSSQRRSIYRLVCGDRE